MNAGGVGDKESKNSEVAKVPESNPLRDTALASHSKKLFFATKNQTISDLVLNAPKK